MINFLCKLCGNRYKIPINIVIKCKCQDPYPTSYEGKVPGCTCADWGMISHLASCAQEQYLRPLQEAWSNREALRHRYKLHLEAR